jgi:MinD-like ATPase involved in chromosome partitioning or flagellar assembly
MMSQGTIATFYSYKGGVGRTFTLANIGALLSQWGYKVLCIDWDLEAPGLHLYFKPWIQQENRPGLVEMIQAYAGEGTPHWQDFVTTVDLPSAKEPLLLMKAGRLDKTYIQRMQALDWDELYNKHDLGNKLEELRGEWAKHLDFVLIDSRTGVTDIGSICTVQLPDTLLVFLTANDQSLEGSLNVLERIQIARANFALDRARLLIVPVISRFDRREEYKLADEWLAKFAKHLAPIYRNWLHKDIEVADLLNYIRIPYIAFWSFGEKLPVIEKGTNDPQDVGYSLETLASLVAQNFSYSDVLIRNRDMFIDTARRTPAIKARHQQQKQAALKQRTPRHLFLSYAAADERFSRQLQTHLGPLRRKGIINVWDSRSIPAGMNWSETINPRLQEADIILLLISSDYVASPYSDTEMHQAIAQHDAGKAIVILILLRPTDWEGLPISNLATLPSNGEPVSTWRDIDAAWADVARSIREVVEGLGKS